MQLQQELDRLKEDNRQIDLVSRDGLSLGVLLSWGCSGVLYGVLDESLCWCEASVLCIQLWYGSGLTLWVEQCCS